MNKPSTFSAAIYIFTGPTFMGPDDEFRLWNKHGKKPLLVIAMHPFKEVDPMDKYAFVSDGEDTYTVQQRLLERVSMTRIPWEWRPLLTHREEMQIRLKAMDDYFLSVKANMTSANLS